MRECKVEREEVKEAALAKGGDLLGGVTMLGGGGRRERCVDVTRDAWPTLILHRSTALHNDSMYVKVILPSDNMSSDPSRPTARHPMTVELHVPHTQKIRMLYPRMYTEVSGTGRRGIQRYKEV